MAEIIEMPKLSDTMTSGTLIKWLKQEGDEVAAGDMIAEVETDKATMEVENFEDGVILKHYAQEGEAVDIGAPICAVGEKGESAPKVGKKSSAEKTDKEEKSEEPSQDTQEEEKKSVEVAKDTKSANEPVAEDTSESDERIKASPVARRIAADKGISLSSLQGTGPGGRIVKDDVLNAKSAPPAPAATSTGSYQIPRMEDKTEKVSNMRASIAKALVKSKTEAPHFYLQSEVDSAAIIKLRQDLNKQLSELPPEQGGIKFTVNDLILKAAAEAVRRVPTINRSWQGDSILQHGAVHLAFGVAIDEGLVTPVIRDAQGKSLRQISAEAKDLIAKARNRKLKPDEMSGSTLTVTNLGMFGITDFYGIINPGNAAILSIGATIKTPVVDDKNQITIGYRMKIGLSGDHRVIDGAVGAQYLDALRNILETPSTMLV